MSNETISSAWARTALSMDGERARFDGFFSGLVTDSVAPTREQLIASFATKAAGLIRATQRAFQLPAEVDVEVTCDCEQAMEITDGGRSAERPFLKPSVRLLRAPRLFRAARILRADGREGRPWIRFATR